MMKLDINWLAAVTIFVLLISCIVGYRKGFIKEVVSTFFVVLALVLVWVINPYVNQFLMEKTPVYETLQNKGREALKDQMIDEDASRESQGNYIEELPLPEFLKDGMIENNNSEVYQFLAVDTFSDYLASYLAKILTSGIGFLVSYLLATVLIRIVVCTLDLIARLPVLRGINRFAGIFIGAIRGLIFIWIAFLVITICWNTPWGQECIKLIEGDRFLSFLYEKNIFVDVFMSIFYGK